MKYLQYLSYLIFETGIEPSPEKLDSIQDTPPSRNLEEVKQFLGLAGYYRKFVPNFVDIFRPLTSPTKKTFLLS